jgi:hypothetical protein
MLAFPAPVLLLPLPTTVKLQTGLVLHEARMAEEAIRRGLAIAVVEYDEDDPNAFHVSRARSTAIILLFPKNTGLNGG